MKIKFSYIFDEELDRVYECFTDFGLNSGIAFKDLITKLKFIKGGERFDEENSEYIAIWKNYYEIRMVVENIKKESYFRTYTNRSLSIDKLPSGISLVYSFYWNSIEEKTIFILEFVYQDEFFADLYKNEFNKADKIKICVNVENYLNSIIKGLEFSNTVVIKTSFDNLWQYMKSPTTFFGLLFKEFIIVCKDEQISLDTEIVMYIKENHLPNSKPLIQLLSDTVIISSQYCKFSLISANKCILPNQKLLISIKLLDKKRTCFYANIKVLECITHEAFTNLRKLWRKKIIEFVDFFESENKRK